MSKFNAYSVAALLLTVAGICNTQATPPLTNDVPIPGTALRLVISDSFDLGSAMKDEEIDAALPCYWILHNATSNYSSAMYMGESSSLCFAMSTTNGVALAMTRKGEEMNRGPRSLTNFRTGRSIRVGVGPGGLQCSDLPRISELFNFPSNSTYILEVRYWSWIPKSKFVLSPPVRVKVIKGR